MRRITAKKLVEKWGIPTEHALYRETGDFYNILKRFPGALCDIDGYILFQTEEEYRSNQYLVIIDKNNHTHVEGGISSLPGYINVEDALEAGEAVVTATSTLTSNRKKIIAEMAIQTCNISKSIKDNGLEKKQI